MSYINVGDEVYTKQSDGSWSKNTYKVLYIHQRDERKWFVVAYLGDIPRGYLARDLKKESVVTWEDFLFVMDGKSTYWKVKLLDGVPDWSTVKENE